MKKRNPWKAFTRVLLLCLMGLVLASCGGETGKVYEKGAIASDTTWEGQVLIKGDLEVKKGVTLTVKPGTVVKFAKIEEGGPGNLYATEEDYFRTAELIVKGRLIAKGTKDRMIRFVSAEKSPRPGDWGAVNFQDSSGNIVEYCEMAHSDTAVHGHGVQVSVAHCLLHDNGTAVGYKSVPRYNTQAVVSIEQNRIINNAGGILCGKDSKSSILHNEISNNQLYGILGKQPYLADVRLNNITGNGKAILIYATKGFRIRENNITETGEYHISLLDGQRWDVDASHNWWGTTNKTKIKEKIWDRDVDRTLGRVIFSDLVDSPVQGAGSAG